MKSTIPTFHLTLDALSCARGDRLLFAAVSAVITPGDLIYIHGANGIGKTTLLRCVAGLIAPTQGKFHWNHVPRHHVRNDFMASMAYLGHVNPVKKTLSVIESLLYSVPVPQLDKKLMQRYLSDFNLTRYQHHRVCELSQGQSRRLALIQMMLKNAALWLLDEPYSGLDVDSRQRLSQYIQQHLLAGGACLLVSHIADSQLKPTQTLALSDYISKNRLSQ